MGKRSEDRKAVARGVARAIAEDLFVNVMGQHADRLVLVDAKGKDLGGWCRRAVEERVKKLVYAAIKGEPTPPRAIRRAALGMD